MGTLGQSSLTGPQLGLPSSLPPPPRHGPSAAVAALTLGAGPPVEPMQQLRAAGLR